MTVRPTVRCVNRVGTAFSDPEKPSYAVLWAIAQSARRGRFSPSREGRRHRVNVAHDPPAPRPREAPYKYRGMGAVRSPQQPHVVHCYIGRRGRTHPFGPTPPAGSTPAAAADQHAKRRIRHPMIDETNYDTCRNGRIPAFQTRPPGGEAPDVV